MHMRMARSACSGLGCRGGVVFALWVAQSAAQSGGLVAGRAPSWRGSRGVRGSLRRGRFARACVQAAKLDAAGGAMCV